MNNDIKITIATVCYNAVNHIEESVISVVNQTYPNLEYVIIDGGSSDGTIDILRKYKNRISLIISEPDKGIYDAMNKALTYSTGDFLLFLGSDDHLISFDVISKVVEQIQCKSSVYYGNVFRNSRNDIYKGHFGKFKISLENICHQSIFYPREVYKKYKYNLDYKVYADYFNNLTIFPKVNFVYLPLTISYYNYEGFSSSSKDEAFAKIVDNYIRKQNGLLAWFLRKFYLLYKYCK